MDRRPLFLALPLLLASPHALGQSRYPAAPSELRARLAPGERVEISWRDNSPDEEGFWIERRTVYQGEADRFRFVCRTGKDATRYTHVAPIRRGEVNYFRVRAFNRIGNSDFSNVAVYRR